jgi:leader peptidase (prepilin peptidase) / N-methyltransferase
MRRDVLVIIALGGLGVLASFWAEPNLRGVFGAALALLMLAIAVSDLRHFIVPNVFTGTAFLLGLIAAALFGDPPLMQEVWAQAVLISVLRAVATALPFLALMLFYEWWRGRPGLGLGDVKLAAVAGVWLDWITIVGVIEIAALTALAAYIVWRYVLRRPMVATTPLPFGLFLAPAIWCGWLAEAMLPFYRH